MPVWVAGMGGSGSPCFSHSYTLSNSRTKPLYWLTHYAVEDPPDWRGHRRHQPSREWHSMLRATGVVDFLGPLPISELGGQHIWVRQTHVWAAHWVKGTGNCRAGRIVAVS